MFHSWQVSPLLCFDLFAPYCDKKKKNLSHTNLGQSHFLLKLSPTSSPFYNTPKRNADIQLVTRFLTAEAGLIEKLLLGKRGQCVIDSMGTETKPACRAIDRRQAPSNRGMWQSTAGDEPLNMAVFILSLTLKKKKSPPQPTTAAHWLSCIHATIRVVQAEMLERALSLWMYVTLACPVTLSRSDVFQQAQSGLQSSSSDQAQRPICRLKKLCLLLSNSFYVQNCTEADIEVLMRQKKKLGGVFYSLFFLHRTDRSIQKRLLKNQKSC